MNLEDWQCNQRLAEQLLKQDNLEPFAMSVLLIIEIGPAAQERVADGVQESLELA